MHFAPLLVIRALVLASRPVHSLVCSPASVGLAVTCYSHLADVLLGTRSKLNPDVTPLVGFLDTPKGPSCDTVKQGSKSFQGHCFKAMPSVL
jgi:hypothetical protein